MRSRVFRCALLVAVAAAMLSVGCGKKEAAKKAAPGGRPNVIVILIDALRRDHVGAYGYGRATSPFIDSLAKDGMLVKDAVSQAPWTEPSVASIFTSKYTFQVGAGVRYKHDGMAIRGDEVYGIGPEAFTMAEALRQGGYRTACVSANPFVKSEADLKEGEYDFGMSQGFDYNKYLHVAKADKMFGAAEEYLDGLGDRPEDEGRPFYLYLHMMDVHSPTNPPPPFDTKFMPLDPSQKRDRYFDWEYDKGKGLDTPDFREFRDHKTAFYDGGLAFLDSELAKFVDYLKENDLYENTVIVIASDHGEELWDHTEFELANMKDIGDDHYGAEHARVLFRELVDVPLIFHGPGVPAGRVKEQVRNVDIMPTVLGLAGVKVKPGTLEGVDIISAVKAGTLKDLPAFSEQVGVGYEKKGLQKDGYKYIMYISPEEKGFLFDKKSDPLETTDVSGKHPDTVKKFRSDITAFMKAKAEVSGSTKKAEAGKMSEDTKKQLKSLGYLH